MVEATLVLRPRLGLDQVLQERVKDGPLQPRIPRQEIGQLRGASPQAIAAARSWLQGVGAAEVTCDSSARMLTISAPLSVLASAFKTTVKLAGPAGDHRRTLATPMTIPHELSAHVVAVLGIETGPFVPPRLRRFPLPDPTLPLEVAAPLSFEPPEVAALYQYPAADTSAGTCIGLLELGGGYRQADLDSYFQGLGIAPPTVVSVAVAGGSNQPTGSVDGPDGEVSLDIQVAGSIAPMARLAAYFAPNTDQGFLAAVQAAVHDRTNAPGVLSISWGGPEANWPSATINAFEHAFQDASLIGMTVCVAAGDNGSSDGLADGLAHVDYPAASPYVLACGGTRLEGLSGRITSEVVWNDQPQDGATGGGVSAVFALPPWQSSAGVPASVNPGHFRGRGVPDVAGDADPETGYRVLVDSQPAVFGGTSAVAPLWAALLAICNGAVGTDVGYLNPLLYQQLAPAGVTREVAQGDNGAYSAGPGWNACAGWGSPIGSRLLASLRARAGG
jgi:kumamolisin